MLQGAPLYPATYEEARQNFREAASNVGARLEQHTLPESGPVTRDNLSIDVAVLGAVGSDWSVVVYTGLHGIEGFFGSAIQTASLKNIKANRGVGELTAEVGFIHSLNPFGFDKLRHVNEDNVDLNRNFVLP